MLGSKCCCGGIDCAKCKAGEELPSGVSVTFPDGNYGPMERGGDLIKVKVTSDFGSGARFRITGPGGYPESEAEGACPTDAGAITEGNILTLSHGSGYAVINRVKPEVTAGLFYNNPLDGQQWPCPEVLSVTISEGSDGGLPFWYVSGYSIAEDCGIETDFSDFIARFEFEEGTVVVEQPCIYRGPVGFGIDLQNFDSRPVGGYFYKLDTDNVITADVQVELEQLPPGQGSGATIKAVVVDDPTSSAFGTVNFEVEDGGSDYLAWAWQWPCNWASRPFNCRGFPKRHARTRNVSASAPPVIRSYLCRLIRASEVVLQPTRPSPLAYPARTMGRSLK